MTIDTILTPAEIDHLPERDLSETVCVVFDVLRATSSMTTALAHGARDIRPVATIEEALTIKAHMPDVVLGGERHGDPIPGFDVGNSPLEYLDCAGRSVVSTTTNGTVALRACAGASDVIVASLLNLDAVADYLRVVDPLQVLIICAGTFREPALEDILAAGALVDAMAHGAPRDASQPAPSDASQPAPSDASQPAPSDASQPALSDASQTALIVYQQSRGDLLSVLRRTRNGRALITKRREAEVEWCARRSVFPVVGVQRNGVVTTPGRR